MNQRGVAFVVACSLVAAGGARGQERSWYQATPEDRVSINLPVDLALVGVGLLGTLGTELAKKSLAPENCVVCNGPDNSGLGDGSQGDLNGVDAYFHDQLTGALFSRKTADTISNVWVAGLVPIYAIGGSFAFTGPHASNGAGLRNSLLVVESAFLSLTVIQSAKFFIARKRPFVRYGHGTDGEDPDTGKTYDVNDKDSHISFPSGHTALATSLSVSLAMLATLEDSKAAPYLWAGAGVASVGAATLRMMAEKHYFTDVAVGALVGTGVGVLVPYLHRRGGLLAETNSTLSMGTSAAGAPMIAWSGRM